MDSCAAAEAYANSMDVAVWLATTALWILAITFVWGHVKFMRRQ